MTVGQIIFAVMVGIQGLLFLVGAALMIAFLIQKESDNLYIIAFILWAISPVFSSIGAIFGAFL